MREIKIICRGGAATPEVTHVFQTPYVEENMVDHEKNVSHAKEIIGRIAPHGSPYYRFVIIDSESNAILKAFELRYDPSFRMLN